MRKRSLDALTALTALAFGGLMLAAARLPSCAQDPIANVTNSSNGWDQAERDKFYFTSQGSQLVPYDWFLALERADGETLFHDNLARFNFLPAPLSPENPDHLPLGFVKDETDKTFGGLTFKKWVGLTCAACHTGGIRYKASPSDTASSLLIVDGAPGPGNFGAFMQQLASGVAQTDADSAKFDRFAHRVLGSGDSEGGRQQLHGQFHTFTTRFARLAHCSQSPVEWGPGRVDAFGVIFNCVCDLGLDMPQNYFPADAPVSFPFLWNMKYQDHIQWHGEVPNRVFLRPVSSGFNALARNAGEVMGVFAHIDIDPNRTFYNSSVQRLNLLSLEHWVDDLRAPQWPEAALGRIDRQSAARGKTLYRQNCVRCHAELSANPFQVVRIKPYPLSEIETDPTSTLNVHTHLVQTGPLKDHHITGLFSKRFKSTAPAADVVQHAVFGALFNLDLLNSGSSGENMSPDEVSRQLSAGAALATTGDVTKIGYEARPLNGIWATAPYLHNGSVPSLYQLLLPPEQRMKKFRVGTLLFDPVNVGYQTDAPDSSHVYDTDLPGNHNSGHEYGTKLSDPQKRDLVEYMKTL